MVWPRATYRHQFSTLKPTVLPQKHALSHVNGVIERVHPEPRRMGDPQQLLLNIAPQDSAIRIRNGGGLADCYREKKELTDRAKKVYL